MVNSLKIDHSDYIKFGNSPVTIMQYKQHWGNMTVSDNLGVRVVSRAAEF